MVADDRNFIKPLLASLQSLRTADLTRQCPLASILTTQDENGGNKEPEDKLVAAIYVQRISGKLCL